MGKGISRINDALRIKDAKLKKIENDFLIEGRISY